jgi:carboxypeptidase C (cathepsin A)
MGRLASWVVVLMIFVAALPIRAIAQTKDDTPSKSDSAKDSAKPEQFKPEQQASKGSVTVGGSVVNYDAYAGTLVVHTKDWDDVRPERQDPDA